MDSIINYFIVLLQKLFYDKPKKEHEQIHKPTNSPELFEIVRTKGREYEYEDDRLVLDSRYDSRLCNKSLFVIHFAGHQNFQAVIKWLTKGSGANSTFIIDKDGKTVRTLPSFLNPSWTQGLKRGDRGGFLNKDYKFVKQVNNFAVSVEMVGEHGDTWTKQQYEKIATLIWYTLETCKDFRFWFTCSHSVITPFKRTDPGFTFDWRYLFTQCLGVEEWFYEDYLIYLEEVANKSPGLLNSGAAERKLFYVREALDKMALDLAGKEKSYGLVQ